MIFTNLPSMMISNRETAALTDHWVHSNKSTALEDMATTTTRMRTLSLTGECWPRRREKSRRSLRLKKCRTGWIRSWRRSKRSETRKMLSYSPSTHSRIRTPLFSHPEICSSSLKESQSRSQSTSHLRSPHPEPGTLRYPTPSNQFKQESS